MRQLALPFIHRTRFSAEAFLPTEANASALSFLAPGGERDWPARRLALWGPPGAGKTHLLHLWLARHRESGAAPALLEGAAVASLAPDRPLPSADALAVDDIDACPDPEALLHLLNRAAEAKIPLLLASRIAPARIDTPVPDLASRLAATLAIRLDDHQDDILEALLARLAGERQLHLSTPVARHLRLHLPRDAAALREALDRLDRLSLETGRPPTIAAIRSLLADPPPDTAPEPSPSGLSPRTEVLI